jgi:SWI/SNF-related matrix-associated actin-dependent regulator 1 of chromatin subfamily A
MTTADRAAEYLKILQITAQAEARFAERRKQDEMDIVADVIAEEEWRTQQADEIPEPEDHTEEYKAIHNWLLYVAREHPGPHQNNMLSLAIKQPDKWRPADAFTAWLFLQGQYKPWLIEHGFDPSTIKRPLTKVAEVEVIKPIKEVRLDDRSLGFVLRFRYLDKEEHDRVRRAMSDLAGRQYHDGSKPGARMQEPHWYIPGDAPGAESLKKYLYETPQKIQQDIDWAIQTYGEQSSSTQRYLRKRETLAWSIQDGVDSRIEYLINRASRLVLMSKAHEPTEDFTLINEYVNDDGSPLREFQKADIQYLLETTRESRESGGRYGNGSYLGNPMGLGKTPVAIATVCESWEHELRRNPHRSRQDLRCLVLCPASVKINWLREVFNWTRHAERLGYTVQILRGGGPQQITGNFVIANPQLLRKWQNKDTWTWEPELLFMQVLTEDWFAIIADEAHMYKTWKAQRTSNALELFSGKRWDAKKLNYVSWRRPVPLRLMLSGTAILNRPAEWASQLYALGLLDQFGGESRYISLYCTGYASNDRMQELNLRFRERGYRRVEKEDMAETPECKIVPLHNVPKSFGLNDSNRNDWPQLLQNHGWSFVPGVLGQLPPKTRTVVRMSLSNREEYRRVEKEFRGWLLEHYEGDMERFLKSLRGEAMVQITKLKWCAARGKVKAAISWLNDFLEETEDQKIVIYVDHRDIWDQLMQRYMDKAVGIIGGQTEDQRQAAIDNFQTDPNTRVMVAMLTAGGIGITLTAASHLVFLELGWTPAIHDQAEDRIWGRINDLHGANIYYFLAENTIDTNISKMIDRKREVVTGAIQGTEADQTAMLKQLILDVIDEGFVERTQEASDESGDDEDDAA